jgi:carboxylesterase type B
MGESAGALSILHHLTSPAYLADPFFKRAILQSATISESTSYNLNDGYRIGSMWAYEAGCSTPGRVVECMRKIEPQKLARTMLFRWSVVEDKYMKHNLIFPLNDGVNFPSLTTAFKEGML